MQWTSAFSAVRVMTRSSQMTLGRTCLLLDGVVDVESVFDAG